MAARRRSVFRERHSVCAMLAERSTHAYREMCLRSGQRWQFGPTPNALERSTRPVLRWNTHEPTFQLAENMSVGARTGRPSPFRFSRWVRVTQYRLRLPLAVPPLRVIVLEAVDSSSNAANRHFGLDAFAAGHSRSGSFASLVSASAYGGRSGADSASGSLLASSILTSRPRSAGNRFLDERDSQTRSEPDACR